MAAIQDLPQATPADLQSAERKAAGSSFYSAMRLMAKPEREAMFAIYAFCRAVDDIADDGLGARDERLVRLNEWRTAIEQLYRDEPSALADFLRPAVASYRLEKEDFFAVIDGMQMDVDEDICGPSLDTLDLYCDRVASAVGRLSVRVFGMEEELGKHLAHHLGRALQLTNILRDIDEDAAAGRLYLPKEFLNRAGIATRTPREAIADARIDLACRALAEIAHGHYAEASAFLGANVRGRLRAPRLMHAVYSTLLRKMERQGWARPRHRAQIGKGELLALLLRHGLRG